MKDIDIIIPIYNAYEYTSDCIKSILKHTDLNKHTLVLINDKSPDEKILPMLQEYVKNNQDKKIVLLENEKNLGFVGTVNRGMQYSNNDVILLNSDTEVTSHWIEKIQECAYSNEYIATVTPLTNNGTICSVPNFGVDNELPKNMTLDEYAEMIEKISKSRYPQLTTGNGYCLFIKRQAIDEIGLFDIDTFGKGYGEENDFCYRALDLGYTNVLCDNTFIYHKGTQSFTKENATASRMELIDEHMKLLRAKHPVYVQRTDMFIANNPLKDIQENIRINIELFHKKKILYLVNEWEENMEMTGGTSLHIKDIIFSNRKNNIASFVLAPDKYDLQRFKLYLYTKQYAKEITDFKTDLGQYGLMNYTNQSYRKILENIFDTFQFDILHVHHFLFQTFDAIDVAKDRGVYTIITLHDLYMSCPSINMVYEDKFCENNPNRDCTKCLHARYGVNSDILTNWRNTCKAVLEKFDKILVPSTNTKKQFEKVYPNIKIEVVEHGVEVIPLTMPKAQVNSKHTFDIAFVGVMAPHKGSNILKQLIKENKTMNTNIKIHLIGKSEDAELRKSKENYTYHGEYHRGELPQLLVENQIDLVCIFTTWPETYSYTLTETYMAKVPVISFDIGAIADRLKQDKLGYVIPFDEEPQKILESILEISKNKEEYNAIKKNFERYQFKTVKEMQDYYQELYQNVESNFKYANMYEIAEFKQQNEAFELEQYKASYGHLVHKYESLRKTKLWKIAKKVKEKIKS